MTEPSAAPPRTRDQTVAGFDAELSALGLMPIGGSHIQRSYRGVLGGHSAQATVSVIARYATGPTGDWVLRVDAPVQARGRLIFGEVPRLLRRRLLATASCGAATSAWVHDEQWAELLGNAPGWSATVTELAVPGAFVELGPALARFQLQSRRGRFPERLKAQLHAFGQLLDIAAAHPSVTQAKAASTVLPFVVAGVGAAMVLAALIALVRLIS